MDQKNETKLKAKKLTERLEGKPELMEQIKGLLALVENEEAMGRKADEIEQEIIDRLQALEKNSLQSWALRASEESGREAKGHVHAKKVWWLIPMSVQIKTKQEPQRGSALQPKVARVREGYLGYSNNRYINSVGVVYYSHHYPG